MSTTALERLQPESARCDTIAFAELKRWPTYLNQSQCNLVQRRTVLHVSPHGDVAAADAQLHCNDVAGKSSTSCEHRFF